MVNSQEKIEKVITKFECAYKTVVVFKPFYDPIFFFKSRPIPGTIINRNAKFEFPDTHVGINMNLNLPANCGPEPALFNYSLT